MTTTNALLPVISVADIRKSFLDFYAAKGHTVVASSSLVPGSDPTLMFTNSGMVQFKDVFLGLDERSYVRAASVQACLRAGGKHNDLENVGYTARHHTFFEMMGNWSFGDYFKRDSLKWGWELLTQVYKLPAEKLTATVYIDDQEAYDIWHDEIGLPAERIIRIGDNKGKKYASDNFWMMADTGPCGPCSEIFYDHGDHIPGGPPGSPGEDGDRFIEIWNHVFMQFDMQSDGSLNKLPAPCVDTGMGLERLAAILQHVHSNYEIDIFDALIKAAARETGEADLSNKSLRVIADHIRATAFLVSDGVNPSNEGRGYVQRRIIRRAIRHGYKLGQKTPFFHKLVPDLVALMGDAYPRLKADGVRVMDVLRVEEERFFETLEVGMKLVMKEIADCRIRLVATCLKLTDPALADWSYEFGDGENGIFIRFFQPTIQSGEITQGQAFEDPGAAGTFKRFDVSEDANYYRAQALNDLVEIDKAQLAGLFLFNGNKAFILHDTYGFPLDLTNDVCRELGVSVDVAEFHLAMDKQKAQARAAGKFKMDKALDYSGAGHPFTGYTLLEESAVVVALYLDGIAVQSLNAGQNGVVVLNTTPFYAESGGQVGDQGMINAVHGRFCVETTQKIKSDVFGHIGEATDGVINVGDSVHARVRTLNRNKTAANHSATHLMHLALRDVLGSHVQQKGSLVDADKTRFDFSHGQSLTDQQIGDIEDRVNYEIMTNTLVDSREMEIDEAVKSGATMLFGEKYGDTVRVLSIGNSKEFCGGIHVERTGDIGLFKIISESGVAAGVRRIEAVTGRKAIAYLHQLDSAVKTAAGSLKANPAELQNRIDQVLDHVKTLEKEVAALKGKLASSQGDELMLQAVDVNGIKVLAARLEGADAKTLRDTVDKLKDKLKTAVIVLAAVEADKVQIAAGVTFDAVGKVKAGELVNFVAQQVGGKGGGKADMAMAGGTDASKLGEALKSVQGWVRGRV